MKKLFSVLVLVTIFVAGAVAQPRMNEKTVWKMAKKEAKKLQKEGWEKSGSVPLENALYDHYAKLFLGEKPVQELVGNVLGNTSVTTVNQGDQWARTMVCISYSKQAGQTIRGRIAAEMGAGLNGGPAADAFYEAYESKVEKELKGEIRSSFGVYRTNKDGKLDYKGYFLVDEEEAHRARMRAWEMAREESEFARQNAERISEFVQEAFDVEAESN